MKEIATVQTEVIAKHRICVRFRATQESGPGLNWRGNGQNTDIGFCCSDRHKNKLDLGTHMVKR